MRYTVSDISGYQRLIVLFVFYFLFSPFDWQAGPRLII